MSKSKEILKTVLGFLLGAALAFILIFILVGHENSDTPTQSGGLEMGVIDSQGNAEFEKQIQDMLNATVEEGMVKVFMNTNIHLKDGESQAELLIQNTEDNKYSQEITIYLGDEEIYQSPVIKPGYKIERDYLETTLDEGVYEASAKIKLLDSETGNYVNTVNLNSIQIVVES